MDQSLEKILCEIDKFSTKPNRESLKFLARAFAPLNQLERIPEECLSLEIFRLLCLQASTGQALSVLHRMLVLAKYDGKRVSALSRHLCAFSMSLAPTSDTISSLSFHELLLIISHRMSNNVKGEALLQHLLDEAPENEIGSARGEVTSPLQLFTGMLTTGALSPSKPSTLDTKVRERLCKLMSSDEEVVMIVADIDNVMRSNVQVGQHGDIEVKANIQDSDPQSRKKWNVCKRKCLKCTLCATILSLLLLIIIMVLTIHLMKKCLSDGQQLKNQTIQSQRNFTFLALENATDGSKYSMVQFELHQEQGIEKNAKFTTCSVPCDNITETLSTSHTHQCQAYSQQDCYIQFNQSKESDLERSPYVAQKSNFTIVMDPDDLADDNTTELFLFYDITTCQMDPELVLHDDHAYLVGRNAKAGPIVFDKKQPYFSMVMKNDSFICAYWNTSRNITYHLRRSLLIYDFHPLPNCTSTYFKYPKKHYANLTGKHKQCILASVEVPDEYTNVFIAASAIELGKWERIKICLSFPKYIAIVTIIVICLISLILIPAFVLLYYLCCIQRHKYYYEQYQSLK